MRNNWLVSDTHKEPTNEELAIKPWFEDGYTKISAWFLMGATVWALILMPFI